MFLFTYVETSGIWQITGPQKVPGAGFIYPDSQPRPGPAHGAAFLLSPSVHRRVQPAREAGLGTLLHYSRLWDEVNTGNSLSNMAFLLIYSL